MGFLLLGSMGTGFGRRIDWAQCGCEGGESTSDTARLDELKTKFPRSSKNLLYIIIIIIILSIEKRKVKKEAENCEKESENLLYEQAQAAR